ncbi:MAG: hypothetical protein NC099_02915 [Corallococcus sp.]|nr:hypothetical protein [Corallococcus sp.]
MPNKKQIKSRERVVKHGEVFTNEREVKAMCDLVNDETKRIESRFLEPACGDGNFLAEILMRKLQVVKKNYGRYSSDYEKQSVVAVTSLYGVDILQDNVIECRKRLFDIWDAEYRKNCKSNVNEQCRKAVEYILSKNILCGDALTMLKPDGTPIVFAEWSLLGTSLKRRDYTLANLLNKEQTYDLPNYEGTDDTDIPVPVKDYPLTHYRSVQDYE